MKNETWGDGIFEELPSSFSAPVERPVPYPDSYWVLPGKFLAGEYPRTRNRDSSVDKLNSLLKTGVRAFIDLTEEGESGLEPYEDLVRELAVLRGFLCSVDRFPITDGGVPSIRDLLRIHRRIDEHLVKDRTVYVHCWGGHGRTGVVVGTWLIAHGLALPSRAVETLKILRRNMGDGDRPSPETEGQVATVENWPVSF